MGIPGLYAARISEKMTAMFDIHVLEWSPGGGWYTRTVDLPQKSDVVAALGTGSDSVQDMLFEWNKTDVRETSRAVFGAFCDAIRSRRDPHTGGVPQLVGLYRIGASHEFGVVKNDRIYLNGIALDSRYVSDALECRNESFERCSSVTRRPLPDAQRQPRPAQL